MPHHSDINSINLKIKETMKATKLVNELTKEEQMKIFGGEMKKVIVLRYENGRFIRVEKYIEV